MKRVWKITLWSTAVLGVLVVAAAGLLYWKLTTMDLGAIRDRHVLQGESSPGGAGGAGGGAEGNGGQLPASLSGAVGKADALADKPIQSDDALDAAAILLQSGLSLREMYYLMGRSTETLSTEEKQHIRDLLLAKLDPEEIEALRAITSGYGKHLVILDPDYPIEAVGVKDDAERDRIIYEHRQAQQRAAQQEQDGTAPPTAAGPGSGGVGPDVPASVAAADRESATDRGSSASSGAAGSSGGDKGEGGQSAGASGNKASSPEAGGDRNVADAGGDAAAPDRTTSTADASSASRAEQLAAPYHRQLQTLKTSCVQEAERMLGEILTLLEESSHVSAQGAAEQDLLAEIDAAEQRCDRQYEQLVAQAEAAFKKAKLSFAIGQSWDQEYEQTKASIRERATRRIQAKL